MRRKDRLRDKDFAYAVIDKSDYGVLSMADENGHPYGVPVNVVRIQDTLYIHGAKAGKKQEILRTCPKACFSFVTDTKAMQGAFSMLYQSAICFGEMSEVQDPEEKKNALRALSEKYCPQILNMFEKEYTAFVGMTAVWRMPISSIMGKSNYPEP